MVVADDLRDRAALIIAIQNWLGESEQAKKNAAMPGYLSVGMSCRCGPMVEAGRCTDE